MNDYIQLTAPPAWCIQYPTCSACDVALDFDDGWTCPTCGTQWGNDANDGDVGTLYVAWSGESPDGPIVPNDDAWKWGDYHTRMERHLRMPTFCPKPDPPASSGAS